MLTACLSCTTCARTPIFILMTSSLFQHYRSESEDDEDPAVDALLLTSSFVSGMVTRTHEIDGVIHKWCFTCKIWRKPGTVHCGVCGTSDNSARYHPPLPCLSGWVENLPQVSSVVTPPQPSHKRQFLHNQSKECSSCCQSDSPTHTTDSPKKGGPA